MSTFPLDEPHLAALRSLCELCGQVLDVPLYLQGMVKLANEPLRSAAEALSSPVPAASLVRDLLVRAGVDDAVALSDGEDPNKCTADIAIWGEQDRMVIDCVSDGPVGQEFTTEETARLILALLAPGDRDGAMRALREVGR